MSKGSIARAARWVIWMLSAAAVGAMRPMCFPDGGVVYVASAFLVLGGCALIGMALEKWLLARKSSSR